MSPFENLRLSRVIITSVVQLAEQRTDTVVNVRGIDTTGTREVLAWKWY